MDRSKATLVTLCMTLILFTANLSEWLMPGSFLTATSFVMLALLIIIITKANFNSIDLTSEQNAHSQKLQSLGQLTSAIAHDFNNILTAIIGNSDLLVNRHPPGDLSFKEAYQIKANALRGARLVKQLLAFVRKSAIEPTNVNIPDLLTELEPLFEQIISEKHKVVIQNADNPAVIYADPIQIEQIIINLVTNARDAMPYGGVISISSSIEEVGTNVDTKDYFRPKMFKPIQPGKYIQIKVTDSGTGIPDKIMQKIFDPFFSTKDNSGTGLGLATVCQIINKIGGYILVKSRQGQGTTFLIYIKVADNVDLANQHVPETEEVHPEIKCSDYTVLVVEDEDPVRIFGAHALTEAGFNVMDVRTVEEALELVMQENKKIDILVTDVTLGSMDGPTLAKLIKEKLPEIKVIFTSGYDESSITNIELGEYKFLSKPYSLQELTTTVSSYLAKKR